AIEPWLTDQWYVDAKTLAGPAIEAVERGETVFVPRNWEKTYYEWMRNIQPWCISRQLWWGHRIPAWYAEDGEIFVAESEEEAHAEAEKHYGRKVELVQDEDVLDTWFSSALWPFSTLGWPEETPELKRYYKTDVLVTGFDIIFFWVARMMMMGLHFMKEVPFHTVYIHALVRDEKGRKMSKAKGNVIDPLALVDEYGADAVRFTLAAMAAQGRDIKLAKSRIEGYRNFGTKLWNAARFCQMNGCTRDAGFQPQAVQGTINRWIVAELGETADTVAREIEAYRFNEAAGALYRFVWHVFCDWYLELAKPALGTDDPDTETKNTAAFVLDHVLILLHPFMPFITEELWSRLAKDQGLERATLLMEADWPDVAVPGGASAAREEMNWLVGLVTSIRSVRAEMNVPPGAKIPLMVRGGGPDTAERIQRHEEAIGRLARIRSIERTKDLPPGAVQIVHGEATFILPLADVIDVNQEMKRLEKEISKLEGELGKLSNKLNNEKFLANAPEDVIEEHRERKDTAETRLARLQSALDQISVGVG
ncbi:MAG: class I tRNA ligase family protein, partial [Alphaproteobacteria bacterium]